jgi:molybdopterin-guanine dinucleotide biosynthesis protein A
MNQNIRNEHRNLLTGVVLAGGRSTRMGGQDKGLVTLGDRPMVEYVLDALRPQVADIILNTNRNLDRYSGYGYTVVADQLGDYSGPLAGMASAMARAHTPYILTTPCDSPLLPKDLGQRLYDAMQRDDAEIAVAHDGKRLQPVFALIRTHLLSSLECYLASGDRKIDLWYAKHKMTTADFSDQPEAFMNVNTPQDRDNVRVRLA